MRGQALIMGSSHGFLGQHGLLKLGFQPHHHTASQLTRPRRENLKSRITNSNLYRWRAMLMVIIRRDLSKRVVSKCMQV